VGYKLSQSARASLISIYEYGADAFGLIQADRYHASLTALFERLSDFPEIGTRALDDGERRFPHWPYIVFYRIQNDHIFFTRILHGRSDYNMDPAK